jgi:hypothetical protein
MELQITGITSGATPCYECEYDLLGIPESDCCPMCGADANLSRHRQLLLRVGLPVPMMMTSRKWMRTIAAACGLTIVGALVSMLATGGFLIETHTISKSLGAIGFGLITAGYFILSQREPASRRTVWTRTVAIIARLAPLFGLLLPWGADYLFARHWARDWSLMLLAISIPVSAITWVLLRHIEKLAGRANAQRLRIILSLLKWLAPAALLCQPFLRAYLWIRPNQWVYVAPYALFGYADFVVMAPYSMAAFPRLTPDLMSMIVQAILSLFLLAALSWFSLVLLRASCCPDIRSQRSL